MTQLNVPGAAIIPDGMHAYKTKRGKTAQTKLVLDYPTAIRLTLLGFSLYKL